MQFCQQKVAALLFIPIGIAPVLPVSLKIVSQLGQHIRMPLGILTNVQADQPQAEGIDPAQGVQQGPVGNQRHAVFQQGFSA